MEDLQRETALDEEDRISKLPDELIHQILSFADSRLAVQTAVLSKRWVNVWSTLPFLNFDPTLFDGNSAYYRNFVINFLSLRNQHSAIFTIKVDLKGFHYCFTQTIIRSVLSDNLEEFHLCVPKYNDSLNLPVLKTLHFSQSIVMLKGWWLPSLTTLHLQDVIFHHWKPAFGFEHLHSLKNLTLVGCRNMYGTWKVFRIDSPSLESLTMSQGLSGGPPTCKFVVSTPNLSFFKFSGSYVPKLSAEDGFSSLEEVNIDIIIPDHDWEEDKILNSIIEKLVTLFHEFHRTKCLKLSFETVEVLSYVPDFSKYQSSQFNNLKTLYLLGQVPPQTANPTYFTNYVIDYLLNGSPHVKIFIQDYNGKIRNYSPKVDMLLMEGRGYSLGYLKENIADHKYVRSNIFANQDAVDEVLKGIPPDIIHELVNDRCRSYSDKCEFSRWEGFFVYPECKGLLNNIKEQHPETFEHFEIEPITEIRLPLFLHKLCSTIAAFSEVARSSFSSSTINRCTGQLADLEKWGFNIKWLRNRRKIRKMVSDADKNELKMVSDADKNERKMVSDADKNER